MSEEEKEDLEKATTQLKHYEQIYKLMEYGNDISNSLTVV
jgi:hypothetical protein